MRADRNLKLMMRYTMCNSALFIVPVMVPFYNVAMGMSFNEALIVQAVFAATVVVLEVPMGWLSDQWQRKHVLALAALVEIIGYACLLVGDNIWWAAAGEAIVGVAICLISGTNVAMIYDSLLSVGRTDEFRRNEGKRSAMGFYSVAACSVVGSLLYKVDIHLPVLMTMVFLTGSLAFACMMEEPERHRVRPEKHPLADMVATTHYALRGHAEVGLIILFAAVMFSATKLIMWSQQPYYMAIGLDEGLFGVLMAVGFLLAGSSSHLAHKLDGKVGNLQVLAAVWLVALVVCLVTGLHQGPVGVAFLMVGGSCLFGLANPRVSEAINRRVDSSRRATVLSTQGLMISLFFVPTSLVVGAVNDHHGIAGSLLAIAGWLAVAGVLLSLLLVNKDRRRRLLML